MLDSSGSIRDANPDDGSYDNFELMLEFVIDIIQRLDIGDMDVHVGVVSFSHTSRVEFHLDEYFVKHDLVEAIRKIQYIGSYTHTAAGLKDMRTLVFDPTKSNLRGDRNDVPNLAIVITDGMSNENEDKTIPYANDAKNDGIIVLAVGVTDDVNEAELAGISSNGREGETYWTTTDFRVLDRVLPLIVERACTTGTG